MNEWCEYTGSDEQIDEMCYAKNGFIVKSICPCILNDVINTSNIEGLHYWIKSNCTTFGVTEYWLIPDDPLREMKVQSIPCRWSIDHENPLECVDKQHELYMEIKFIKCSERMPPDDGITIIVRIIGTNGTVYKIWKSRFLCEFKSVSNIEVIDECFEWIPFDEATWRECCLPVSPGNK